MLKPNTVATLLLAGLVTMAHPAVAGTLPATLEQALQGSELDQADAWSYRKTAVVSAMGKKTVRTVTRWDMSKPVGKRCTVVSVEVLRGDASKDKEETPCGEGKDRETYGDLKKTLDAASSIETVSEDDTEAVYRVVPGNAQQPGFHMGGVNVDLSDDDAKDMIGTLHVTKTGPGGPYVDRFALQLRKPVGNLIASVSKLDITYHYSPDQATGARLLRGMDLDLDMTMFAVINVTTVVHTRYDEYKRIQ